MGVEGRGAPDNRSLRDGGLCGGVCGGTKGRSMLAEGGGRRRRAGCEKGRGQIMKLEILQN